MRERWRKWSEQMRPGRRKGIKLIEMPGSDSLMSKPKRPEAVEWMLVNVMN